MMVTQTVIEKIQDMLIRNLRMYADDMEFNDAVGISDLADRIEWGSATEEDWICAIDIVDAAE